MSHLERGYIEGRIAVAAEKKSDVLYIRGTSIPHHYHLRALPPELIGAESFGHLKELHLSTHKIDHLPREFGLTKLTILNLESNRLREFPEELLGSMVKLRKLLLGHNHLTEIPDSISLLTALDSLCFPGNEVEEFPAGLGACVTLRHLDATRNRIAKVPAALGGQLKFLETLHVEQNGVAKIEDLGGLTALRVLHMDGSPVKSGLPPSLSSLEELVEFRCSFCFTRAMAKRKGGRMPALDALNALAANRDKASSKAAATRRAAAKAAGLPLPTAAEEAEAPMSFVPLAVLEMRGNNLAEFPEFLGSLGSLVDLNLCQNLLVELPKSLGELKSLKTLRVDRNKLEALPPTLGGCASLVEVHAHSNKIAVIPESIGQLRKLTKLDLSSNKIKHWPPEFGELANLRRLELGENGITSIPGDYILDLRRLQRLGLAQNKVGTLPENFSALAALESLDLADNNLFLKPEVAMDRARMPLLRDLKLEGNPCTEPEEEEDDEDSDSDDDGDDDDGDGYSS